MSDAFCECPRCRRQFPVKWGWDTLRPDYLHHEDGGVVTDSDFLYATRVEYLHHVACPHCGARLRVEHELWPRFYASKEDSNADGEG